MSVLKGGIGGADTGAVEQPPSDGTAAVVDGVLVITPPDRGGRLALLRAGAGVALVTRAGRPTQGPVAVPSVEAVTVLLAPAPPPATVDVEVSADGLTATVRSERPAAPRYALVDQPPQREIVLRRRVVDQIAAPPPTRGEIEQALVAAGVVEGIDHASIDRLVAGHEERAVVAHGIAPIAPQRATLRLHALDELGLPTFVESGTVVAAVQREAGRAGRSVRGETLEARLSDDATPPVLGRAVIESDGRVVATGSGFAVVRGASILVAECRRHERDLTGRDGELVALGGVRVDGGIIDAAVLRTRGDVHASGLVRRASIEAGGSLAIDGTVLDAELRAGGGMASLARCLPVVASSHDAVARLDAAVTQVLQAAQRDGRTLTSVRALAMVMPHVAPTLERALREALRAVEAERGPEQRTAAAALRRAQETLRDALSGRAPVGELTAAAAALSASVDALRAAVGPACLRAPFVQTSQIEVDGRLEITGRGVWHSQLVVRGTLDVSAPGSVVRGGLLRLDGHGRIAELAPRGDLQPVAVLAPGASLEIGAVHRGVIVDIDGRIERYDRAAEGVTLRAELPVQAA